MMLHIRVNELSAGDRDRLRAEAQHALLAEFTYPAFLDYRASRMRQRPPSRDDRLRAEGFVGALKLDDETREIGASALKGYLTEAIMRYYRAVTPPRLQQRPLPVPALAARAADGVQRKLVAYALDGAANGFGQPPAFPSWRASHPDAPLTEPWESFAAPTMSLASALALLRDEPLPTPPRPIVPTVSDFATEMLPALERATLPEPQDMHDHQPTAPMPRAVDLPTPPPSDQNRTDQAVFQQLRQQLLSAMQAAARNYQVTAPPDDPAGLLAALRRRDAIDEGDLRLAEGLLALCGRVVAEGRVGIADYREALTLYLLFNRSRFAAR